MKNVSAHENFVLFGWLLHLAGLGVTLATAGVAVGLLFWPTSNETLAVARQVEAVSDRLEQYPAAVTRHDELQSMLAEREQAKAELEARLPQAVDESEFLRQLAELAQSTGTVIGEYSPGLPTDHGTHGSLEIALKVQAPYADVCRFLAGLEDLPRLCRAKTLLIVAPETDSDEYLVEMTLQIYYRTIHPEGESEVADG